MKNDILLLEKNCFINDRKIEIKNGYAIYRNSTTIFDKKTIKNIIQFVNCLHTKYKNIPIPISFEFEKIIFRDKLTYIYFEIICAILIKRFKHKVYVKFDNKNTIFTEGIESSPVLLLTTTEKQNFEKYISKFNKELYNKHYRRLLSPEDMHGDKLSKLMDDIAYFLKFFQVTSECINDISEVIIELIGNVYEHTDTDCLVDLDVTKSYKKIDAVGRFHGINITVVNFSENLFFEPLKEKIYSHYDDLKDRDAKVIEALNQHQLFFDDDYSEDDFFRVASFQHRISGNEKKKSTGGTGLTKLICSLEERSDTHNCYMHSGNRILWFRHEYMEYNDDKWIGFNDEQDFFGCKPDAKNFETCSVYMPGTAYNLNFVMERVDE